jgi:hypothetical protein
MFGGIHLFRKPEIYDIENGFRTCVTQNVDMIRYIAQLGVSLALGTATYFFIRWVLRKRAQKLTK